MTTIEKIKLLLNEVCDIVEGEEGNCNDPGPCMLALCGVKNAKTGAAGLISGKEKDLITLLFNAMKADDSLAYVVINSARKYAEMKMT